MWHYAADIWARGQPAHFSDLYARWWGARELLLHHRDPYSVAVSQEIQIEIYGAVQANAQAPYAEQIAGGFAYPVYVVFLIWPTLFLPFHSVQVLFAYLLPIMTLLSLLLWLYVLKWWPGLLQLACIGILTLGSFPFVQGFRLQNLSLVVAFLVATTLALVADNKLWLAGIILAFATIKPHFVFLLVLWLIMWAIGDWTRRRRLVWAFICSEAFLILGSSLLAPGWTIRFWRVTQAYKQYTYGHSLLDLWLTPRIGTLAAAALSIAVLFLCRRYRSNGAHTPEFFLCSSLILATTLTIIPTLEPHAQLLLLPGFLFLLRYRGQIWQSSKRARLLLVSAWIPIAWAWVAAVVMVVAFGFAGERLQPYWMVPLYTSPLIPLGVVLVLAVLLNSADTYFDASGLSPRE